MRFVKSIILCFFLLLLATGCAYEKAYMNYASAQAQMAASAGPLVSFHPGGGLASVGNPMIPMAMMNMKAPKSEWETFMETIRQAIPFAAIWGTAMGGFDAAKSLGGGQTYVTGDGNYMSNSAGNYSPPQMGSPTTTTTLSGEGSIGGASEISK